MLWWLHLQLEACWPPVAGDDGNSDAHSEHQGPASRLGALPSTLCVSDFNPLRASSSDAVTFVVSPLCS